MWKLMIFALFCPVYSAPLSKDRYKYKAACKKPEKQGAVPFLRFHSRMYKVLYCFPICTEPLVMSTSITQEPSP